jgi:hypothetical protein
MCKILILHYTGQATESELHNFPSPEPEPHHFPLQHWIFRSLKKQLYQTPNFDLNRKTRENEG